ncbi:winged helix-turn-helix transcriptional regulator [Clostridium sporogenes]|uniref:Winged helix-turn-helix transcriptional regulator n=1 Tax=Clostridium sporogenes TaxID=1509 RepID=A0A7X5P842_CLOSG|nr:winged helix-turn-helix transcriptional regulator [Clostridium sporogenes]AJD31674.1 hxlR-like helix-turn-helix family protein [Clostridium botulinum Prevot_594]KRU41664.1 HxlR-like helix-turn-helix [Clostridium sporogenes]MBA4507453.1 winged helix-turn-helix transcriptional regulator [Clostridium sporogenes]MBY7016617.1 winged helix-turn-helix transcriptional regulator [Clostridium sporogenes]MBY7062945.1 winged helix-turn-helix transcriptional regulator [Clostridium sporogenes]
MNKDFLNIKCNVGLTHQIIQGKWKLVILYVLSSETLRFGQLHRALPDIRQGYLAQQLKELERDGLIHREVYKQVPPKVEYSLTDIGKAFIPILQAMGVWGANYRKCLQETYLDYKSSKSE